MPSLRRLACHLLRLAHRLHAPVPAPARFPELWCRPATVLVLRDPSRASAPLAGWR